MTAAIKPLFRESSRVSKRRVPQRCVAEFTSQVKCQPTTVCRKIAHRTIVQPPINIKDRAAMIVVDVIIFVEKDVERVLRSGRANIAASSPANVLCGAAEDPADMRPVRAVTRAVRIFFRLGECVMDAVRRHPCDRARLNGERAAGAQKYSSHFGVLNPRCVSRR